MVQKTSTRACLLEQYLEYIESLTLVRFQKTRFYKMGEDWLLQDIAYTVQQPFWS
jgi:hypothetical protein